VFCEAVTVGISGETGAGHFLAERIGRPPWKNARQAFERAMLAF